MEIFLLILSFNSLFAANLTTKAEKTDFRETGRYAEVIELCENYSKTYLGFVRCETFGSTPEGRKMVALTVGKHGKRRPVIFFQGGIHAGEIDGKDAGFLVIKEVLEKRKTWLEKVTLVFVPVLNIDGHERFGRYNRPNQVGPEEMGWRTTAQNFNLNRDYMKADAPEMQYLLKYLQKWDPIVYLDLHVTDGAEFQPDIGVMANPSVKGVEPLRAAGEKLSKQVIDGLNKKGYIALPFYPSFVKDDEPSSGFEFGVSPPRFSQSYWGLQQRIGFLIETHSWKNYKRRVFATRDTLLGVIERATEDGKEWQRAAALAVQETQGLGGRPVVLKWQPTKKSEVIEFPGYRYEKTKSEISKQERIKYFKEKAEVWKLPLFKELEPALQVTAPRMGYIVPPAYAALLTEKFKLHGIEFKKLQKGMKKTLEVFRAKEFEFGKNSYEGRLPLQVKGEWTLEEREIVSGSLYVPIAQKNSLVLVHLLEPLAPDSLLAWGYFNAHFEKKEYMEDYVAESVAEEMLAQEKIKQEFNERLKKEDFEKSPNQRLEFFHQKHASWDERYKLYPVYRVDHEPSR